MACLPINEEKCFVEEIHRNMHSEKIMAKKSKPPVKVEKAVVKEETKVVKEEAQASDKEETTVSGKEGEGIDFFYILAGGGVILIVIMVIVIIFRYLLHMI
jgi:hypothetical protein